MKKYIAAIALALSVATPAVAMDGYDATDEYRLDLIRMFRYQPAATLAQVCGIKPGVDYFAVMAAIRAGQQRSREHWMAKAADKAQFSQMADLIFNEVANEFQSIDSNIANHGATMETCLDIRRAGTVNDARAFVAGRP